ncbi:MAG: hypothetical protein ACKV2U_31330 [Bryobacteraceae bacterium]
MRLQSISVNGAGNTLQYAGSIPRNVDVKVVLITHTGKVTDERAAVLRAAYLLCRGSEPPTPPANISTSPARDHHGKRHQVMRNHSGTIPNSE